jgi:CRISPR-associated protein Csx3
LPAVVLGGPPHSGKSVLAYSLTRALREREVPHYVLRAYPPDYEGDWFLAGEPETVQHVRLKGARSEDWLPLVQRDIAARQLPLLVDVGGLPTPTQEGLLEACTHGILLTPDAENRALWRMRFERYQLELVADLRSELLGVNRLTDEGAVLAGTLAGLERGLQAQGPVFEALTARLAVLFDAAAQGLVREHLLKAPVELAVDVGALARQLGQAPRAWLPEALLAVLDYLPERTPLALYGRGPNWLYAAVAVHALPAAFHLFDARLGWVAPPRLEWGIPTPDAPLQVTVRAGAGWAQLDFSLPDAYLDLAEAGTLVLPEVAAPGLVLSGKLPHWLWAGLARHYGECEWLAVAQMRLPGAVVVRSRTPARRVGMLVPRLDMGEGQFQK